jgi:hypothetical protein
MERVKYLQNEAVDNRNRIKELEYWIAKYNASSAPVKDNIVGVSVLSGLRNNWFEITAAILVIVAILAVIGKIAIEVFPAKAEETPATVEGVQPSYATDTTFFYPDKRFLEVLGYESDLSELCPCNTAVVRLGRLQEAVFPLHLCDSAKPEYHSFFYGLDRSGQFQSFRNFFQSSEQPPQGFQVESVYRFFYAYRDVIDPFTFSLNPPSDYAENQTYESPSAQRWSESSWSNHHGSYRWIVVLFLDIPVPLG